MNRTILALAAIHALVVASPFPHTNGSLTLLPRAQAATSKLGDLTPFRIMTIRRPLSSPRIRCARQYNAMVTAITSG